MASTAPPLPDPGPAGGSTDGTTDGTTDGPSAVVPSAAEFGGRSDTSARSVLVTIFGDSVVPAGGEIWLGDLIELCEQFGFNDRLVRTSMFRLGAEGWFEIDRVGRRSRYRLTPRAMAEFAAAEARIYGPATAPWDGWWTLVFLDAVALERTVADEVRAGLGSLGFAPLTTGTLAAPRVKPEVARTAVARIVGNAPVPSATARIDDLPDLLASGWPERAYDLGPVARRYEVFLDRYGSLPDPGGPLDGDAIDGGAAFALRTMVIHELRRARLADPDLPAELLPATWPGPAAVAAAAAIYHRVAEPADAWLATVTDLRPDPALRGHRFERAGCGPTGASPV